MKDKIYISESLKGRVDESQFFVDEEKKRYGIYCNISIDNSVKLFKVLSFKADDNIELSFSANETDTFNMFKSKNIRILSFENVGRLYVPSYFAQHGEIFHIESFKHNIKEGNYICVLRRTYLYSE